MNYSVIPSLIPLVPQCHDDQDDTGPSNQHPSCPMNRQVIIKCTGELEEKKVDDCLELNQELSNSRLNSQLDCFHKSGYLNFHDGLLGANYMPQRETSRFEPYKATEAVPRCSGNQPTPGVPPTPLWLRTISAQKMPESEVITAGRDSSHQIPKSVIPNLLGPVAAFPSYELECGRGVVGDCNLASNVIVNLPGNSASFKCNVDNCSNNYSQIMCIPDQVGLNCGIDRSSPELETVANDPAVHSGKCKKFGYNPPKFGSQKDVSVAGDWPQGMRQFGSNWVEDVGPDPRWGKRMKSSLVPRPCELASTSYVRDYPTIGRARNSPAKRLSLRRSKVSEDPPATGVSLISEDSTDGGLLNSLIKEEDFESLESFSGGTMSSLGDSNSTGVDGDVINAWRDDSVDGAPILSITSSLENQAMAGVKGGIRRDAASELCGVCNAFCLKYLALPDCIRCPECFKWFHRKCVGLPRSRNVRVCKRFSGRSDWHCGCVHFAKRFRSQTAKKLDPKTGASKVISQGQNCNFGGKELLDALLPNDHAVVKNDNIGKLKGVRKSGKHSSAVSRGSGASGTQMPGRCERMAETGDVGKKSVGKNGVGINSVAIESVGKHETVADTLPSSRLKMFAIQSKLTPVSIAPHVSDAKVVTSVVTNSTITTTSKPELSPKNYYSYVFKIKYPCGKCGRNCTLDSILCHKCHRWWHRRCTGPPFLSKPDLLKLAKDEQVQWDCGCGGSVNASAEENRMQYCASVIKSSPKPWESEFCGTDLPAGKNDEVQVRQCLDDLIDSVEPVCEGSRMQSTSSNSRQARGKIYQNPTSCHNWDGDPWIPAIRRQETYLQRNITKAERAEEVKVRYRERYRLVKQFDPVAYRAVMARGCGRSKGRNRIGVLKSVVTEKGKRRRRNMWLKKAE